jgi:hypothetical protein
MFERLIAAILLTGLLAAAAVASHEDFGVDAEQELTQEQADRIVRQAQKKLQTAREIVDQTLENSNLDLDARKRLQQSLTRQLKITSLMERLAPMMVGSRNEEKQKEISRLLAEYRSLVADEQAEQAVQARQEAYKSLDLFDAKKDFASAQSQLEAASKAERQALEMQLKKAHEELAAQKSRLEQALELAKRSTATLSRDLPPIPNGQLQVFKLQSTPANEAAHAIESLFGLQSIRVAIDDRTNSVVVFGKEDTLPAIEALLMKLDVGKAEGEDSKASRQPAKPLQSLLLRIFWLADGLPADEGSDPAEVLPASVLRAAKKLGLAKPRLVTQSVNSLAVRGSDAQEFSASVPALLVKQPVELFYSGKLMMPTTDYPELSMQANVSGTLSCVLKGSLAMPLGHYMVLGTANSVMPKAAADLGGQAMGEGFDGPAGAYPTGGQGVEFATVPGGEAADPAMEGGMAMGRPSQPAKARGFDTLRFAFVVQVIGGQSYAPDDE